LIHRLKRLAGWLDPDHSWSISQEQPKVWLAIVPADFGSALPCREFSAPLRSPGQLRQQPFDGEVLGSSAAEHLGAPCPDLQQGWQSRRGYELSEGGGVVRTSRY